ncbi:hypothetical protein HZB01_04820 [Candidatus Woesearchaeota archaeon]|nr:hypothetical protein [Candidatus Woesearchaeota archaeon]
MTKIPQIHILPASRVTLDNPNLLLALYRQALGTHQGAQRKIAEAAGVSHGTVSNLLSGKQFRADTFEKFIRPLDAAGIEYNVEELSHSYAALHNSKTEIPTPYELLSDVYEIHGMPKGSQRAMIYLGKYLQQEKPSIKVLTELVGKDGIALDDALDISYTRYLGLHAKNPECLGETQFLRSLYFAAYQRHNLTSLVVPPLEDVWITSLSLPLNAADKTYIPILRI